MDTLTHTSSIITPSKAAPSGAKVSVPYLPVCVSVVAEASRANNELRSRAEVQGSSAKSSSDPKGSTFVSMPLPPPRQSPRDESLRDEQVGPANRNFTSWIRQQNVGTIGPDDRGSKA